MLGANLDGAFLWTQARAPVTLRGGADSILNIAPISGWRARRLASRNVTINNLLPGVFDTDRILTALKGMAAKTGKTIEELRVAHRATIPAWRYGTPQEFGQFCAFICSAQAGYLTGQNLLLDGGAYPGTF